MLSSIFLLVTPFLLVAPASARVIKLGPAENADIQCVAVTVTATKTVWAAAPSLPAGAGSGFHETWEAPPAAAPTSASGQAGPVVPPAVFSVASQASQPSPPTAPLASPFLGEATPKKGHPSVAAQPQAAQSVAAQPPAAQSAGSLEPAFNASNAATPPPSFRNALYFTNWYIFPRSSSRPGLLAELT